MVAKKEINYWQDWISPSPRLLNWIRQGFAQNEFFLVKKEANVIGCFRLQWEDELFWGKRQGTAGYIHSFTVARPMAGQGIGYGILNYIASLCLENGKDLLRLDCGADIKNLKNYYESYGFKPVGEVTVSDERLTLYEKQITQKNGLPR